MNIIFDKTLKFARRRIGPFFFKQPSLPPLSYKMDKADCQNTIAKLIRDSKPCMVARFGSVELSAVVNYLGVKKSPHSLWKYIKGETDQWWWNSKTWFALQNNAGFYPVTEDTVCHFAELMIEDAKQIDVLGSWCPEEYYMQNELEKAIKMKLSHIEPAYMADDDHITSWTSELSGKTVLVVHPFEETIKKQYEKRQLLFKRNDILPEFELKTIKAVQSIGGNSNFKTWFDALKHMEDQIDSISYDVCILGCGAYGFPLAAHAKRTGHKAIHLGGATQLLFGIRGKRWEERTDYQPLFNEYWVRPDSKETPLAASLVENGCYW